MITRLILLIIIIWGLILVTKQVRALFFQPEKKKETDRLIMGGEMVQDPICHVYVPKATAIKQKIRDQTYYFCSHECVEKFYESLRA